MNTSELIKSNFTSLSVIRWVLITQVSEHHTTHPQEKYTDTKTNQGHSQLSEKKNKVSNRVDCENFDKIFNHKTSSLETRCTKIRSLDSYGKGKFRLVMLFHQIFSCALFLSENVYLTHNGIGIVIYESNQSLDFCENTIEYLETQSGFLSIVTFRSRRSNNPKFDYQSYHNH